MRSAPASTSWSAIVEPMSPAPPVMSAVLSFERDGGGHGWSLQGDEGAVLGEARGGGFEDGEDPQAGVAARSARGGCSRTAATSSSTTAPQRLALGQRGRDHVADPVGDRGAVAPLLLADAGGDLDALVEQLQARPSG